MWLQNKVLTNSYQGKTLYVCMEYANTKAITQSFKLGLRKWIAEGWRDIKWKPILRLDGAIWDWDEVGSIVHKHLFEKQMFLFIKTPCFVSLTNIEPQKLLSAGRNCSSEPTAEQATLRASSYETVTECDNAVMRLCFLEARKNIAATGKLYTYTWLQSALIYCKMLEKGAIKRIQSNCI